MKTRTLRSVLFLSILISSFASAQSPPPFEITAYRHFLQQNQNLSTEGLLTLHAAGRFAGNLQISLGGVPYLDSIDFRYHLTAYERQLLSRHSFMVTERLKHASFGAAFNEIWHRDLPVFVSTDAILHAIHMSYDAILMGVERAMLIPRLRTLLNNLHAQMPALNARYAGSPAMQTSLKDMDVYLTIPRKLLGESADPFYFGNGPVVTELMQLIQAEQAVSYRLFSTTSRRVDFSQFKVRGHYTSQSYPVLGKYFQAMMWLGRTEMYLIAPAGIIPRQTENDIQRQTIDALLVAEAMQAAGSGSTLNEMDDVIRSFVGEQDNVTMPNIQTMRQLTGTDSASMLLNLARFRAFQDTLRSKAFAFQRYNFQILISDPMNPDSIAPAASFLLLGQRFIIDGYTTASVVYDKIVYQGTRVRRMLPKTLDILFVLGNNGAAQLLQNELNQYHYAPNLAAVRYLVDSYDENWWQGSMYNGWLNSIRTLSPPTARDSLPAFMRTAAWWQEKMNTQLSAWSQLRHDNLLYGKQPYTGGFICSFPQSYVEPVPEFYDAVKAFAHRSYVRFSTPPLNDQSVAGYFLHLRGVADTLAEISRKELQNISVTPAERRFLQGMMFFSNQCSPAYDGWYPKLFTTRDNGLFETNIVVADVHTAPTDANGNPVGWVLHGGTGPINLGVWIAELPGIGAHAFIGPVMSYYEHVTTNFRRFTDEEWRVAYNLPPSFRPSFVNLYLADSTGNSRGGGINLLTSVGVGNVADNYPSTPVLAQNYPNPFNPSTFISFTIPPSYANSNVELTIYDVQGQRVQTLVKNTMPAGNFVARWDGRNEKGTAVASGVYFYKLNAGDVSATKRMIMIK